MIDISEEDRQERTRRQREIQRRKQERYRKELRRKKRKRKIMMIKLGLFACMICLIFILCNCIYHVIRSMNKTEEVQPVFSEENEIKREIVETNHASKPVITEDFLTPNEYSRPGEVLPEVNNIFVHYTANKGTSAAQNRSYFENLGITGETSASAHFVIGYEGEIIQCIPLNEIAYAVQKRNYDSVSIECCYLDNSGKFTEDTYESLIRLSAWLLKEYDLTPEDMRRHYDEGGKKCPLYYVEHEEAWEQFLRDLNEYIAQ